MLAHTSTFTDTPIKQLLLGAEQWLKDIVACCRILELSRVRRRAEAVLC